MQRIVKLKREIGSHTVGVGGDEYAAAVSFYTRPPTYRYTATRERREKRDTQSNVGLTRVVLNSDSITLEEFELFAFDRLRGKSSLSRKKRPNWFVCGYFLQIFFFFFFFFFSFCAQNVFFVFQKF
jgi:hypothetical protein